MPHPGAPTAPWSGRVLVLVGILLVALNLRIVVAATSPVLDHVRRDVSVTELTAGLLGAAPLVAFALVGALTPVFARRLGLEGAVVLAMVVAATGEVARATATGPGALVGWTFVALAGLGAGNVLLPPLVKRYFPDRIGMVTALYGVAMAVSTATPPLVVVPLAEQLGWRFATGAWSAVAILATVPWVVVLASRRGRRRVQAPPAPGGGQGTVGLGLVLRSPLAWGLAIAFGMNSMNTYVLFAWLPSLLVDVGLDPADAARRLALFAALGLPSALVVPLIAERVRRPFGVVVVFCVCLVAGYTGLLLAPTAALWSWVVLLGIGPGTFPLLLTLVNLRTRTPAGATSLSGFVQGVGYTVAVPGPVLVGVLHQRTGGWSEVLVVLAASVGVLLVAGWYACRPVVLEDDGTRTSSRTRPRTGT